MLGEPDLTTLEGMIDRHSVAQVVDALVSICHNKADHIAANWQDQRSSDEWMRNAARLGKVVAKVTV